MANTTNDYNYATTSTGAAIGNTVAKLYKPSGTQVQLIDLVSGTVISDSSGASLSDFSDPAYVIFLPFSGDDLDGTLLGAINNQSTVTASILFESWKPTNTYAAGSTPDFVFYNTGTSVNLYQCIVDVTVPSAVTPDVDTTHWQYVSQSFKVRIIPAENSYFPDTSGGERFKHYATCYVSSVDYSLWWYVYLATAGYTTYNGSYGLPNGTVTDGTNSSNNMIVSGVSSTITTNAFSCTHPNTGYQKIIVGSKVRVRGLTLSGQTVPITVNVSSATTTGFSGTINSLGTYSAGTQYNNGDFVTYTTGGNTSVYFHYNISSSTGFLPTNTTYWRQVAGTISGGTADTVFDKWTMYLDTDFFELAAEPSPAASNSSSLAKPLHKHNNFVYNENIISQKQTLFSTGDYIVHDGFPFDKDSLNGGTMNITAGILSTAISTATRPSITTSDTASLPQSDNRWIPQLADFSGWTYPSNTTYNWSSHNGGTSRQIRSFNDTNHTYLPDLLDGTASSNPSSNANKLMLMSPDVAVPPMTASNSLSFANQDFMYTSFDPFKVNSSVVNDFTTFVVAYLDYIPKSVMNSTVSADETNWYGIMSEAKFSASPTLATDIATLNTYTAYQPRLSVRYKFDGTITLNLGDTVLTALKVKNGVARPFQPVIVGLTVIPPNASGVWTATLTVVDSDVHRSTITFSRNWLGASAETHNVLLYGATPFSGRFHGAKMSVLEINTYFGTHTEQFYNDEIKTMDKMYAVTSGRVS